METRNGLRSLKSNDPNILRTLESCVRIGNPVLLEDVGEALDPALDTLLQKQTFMQGEWTMVNGGPWWVSCCGLTYPRLLPPSSHLPTHSSC